MAKLVPDHVNHRFEIQVITGVSADELTAAEQGTVRDGHLVYELKGKAYRLPIKTLRGDYRDADGSNDNKLRRWQKHDFKPLADDIFQERLYCIQWINADSLQKHHQDIFFAVSAEMDLERDRKVEAIIDENLARWQEEGWYRIWPSSLVGQHGINGPAQT